MTVKIKIECLPEPDLLFGGGQRGGPAPRLAAAGPVDETPVRDVRLALVGPSEEINPARRWLPRLNSMSVACERNARRYRDWPGAPKALGVSFVVEDRFVRPLMKSGCHLRQRSIFAFRAV